MAPGFELLLAAVSTLAVAVLLRRVRQLEREARDPAAEEPVPPSPPPAHPGDARAHRADLFAATYDMLYSPLLVILGQCELARRDRSRAGADDSFRMTIVERQARRMRDLLERQYRPGSAPAPEAGQRRLDPAACMRAAVDQWAGRALERGVRVHRVIESPPAVRCNPTMLRHALRHLVGAAVEAPTGGNGDVTVAVGELDGQAMFAVADDGPGLDAEQLANLFRPVELDQDGEATLSYAIVYALSHALGGSFVLDTAPGEGTRATLRLPLAPTPRRAAGTAAPEVPAARELV